MKRLLAAGSGPIYQLGKAFRRGEQGSRHNPEFTMLEAYRAFADYNDWMDTTEALLHGMAEAINGSTLIEYQGESFDFGHKFERLTVEEAIARYNPDFDMSKVRDRDYLAAWCQKLGIEVRDNYGPGKLQAEIFDETGEAQLRQPTFITQYPSEVSPLARRNDDDPFVTDRFELFIAGREIANGFSELNDPEDQAERFRAQVEAAKEGDDEAMSYDHDYIRALEYGMPPAAGEGIGIDRLVMLLTDSASIRDVILFPLLRPEK